MEICKVSTIKIFSVLVRKVAVERGKSVQDTEVLLTFIRFGYLMEGYVSTIHDVHLDIEFIGEPVEFEKKGFRD